MPARKVTTMATPLQTAEERTKVRSRAFSYARTLLINSVEEGLGQPPFEHIDAETIAQQAWADGYIACLRDIRKAR